jgi:hypothetical protein
VPFTFNVTPVNSTIVTVLVGTPLGVPMWALTQTTSEELALNRFHETGAPAIAVPDGPMMQAKAGQLSGAAAPAPFPLMFIGTVDPELVSLAVPVTSQLPSLAENVPEGKVPDPVSVAVLALACSAVSSLDSLNASGVAKILAGFFIALSTSIATTTLPWQLLAVQRLPIMLGATLLNLCGRDSYVEIGPRAPGGGFEDSTPRK